MAGQLPVSVPKVTAYHLTDLHRISRWAFLLVSPKIFAADLPANLFLACFSLNSLHLFSCSNSLLNNSKHAQ